MDYQIETEFQGPGFVAVPNEVAQRADIPPDALGVLVYLASLPRGFLVRVSCIQERFAMGRDKWQRIARDLQGVGALETRPVRGAGGRVIGKRIVVRWPDAKPAQAEVSTESRETRLSVDCDRKPGFPTVGKPAKQDRETRKNLPANPVPYKDQRSNKARRRAARPCEGPAATSAQAGRSASSVAQAEPSVSAGGSKRPSDPWRRAASAAQAGLRWVDPETGQWRLPGEFPVDRAPSDGVPAVGGA